MKSTGLCFLAFGLLVDICVSVRSEKIECVTMECKMKTIKVPKNTVVDLTSVYYNPYSSSTYHTAYQYPAYHHYYGYTPVSYPGYTHGSPQDVYASYNNHVATYWATSHPNRYISDRPGTGYEAVPSAFAEPHCPTCSQRQSPPSTAVSDSPKKSTSTESSDQTHV